MCLVGTAEPLDKNRLRIFQPTLGFLSAIGKRTMGIMNEGALKFLRDWLWRGSYGEGLQILSNFLK